MWVLDVGWAPWSLTRNTLRRMVSRTPFGNCELTASERALSQSRVLHARLVTHAKSFLMAQSITTWTQAQLIVGERPVPSELLASLGGGGCSRNHGDWVSPPHLFGGVLSDGPEFPTWRDQQAVLPHQPQDALAVHRQRWKNKKRGKTKPHTIYKTLFTQLSFFDSGLIPFAGSVTYFAD